MVRLLHMADLHLGWEPGYLSGKMRKERREERDSVLAKAVDFAVDPSNHIHGVLIVGDLFERYNPGKVLVDDVIRQLERLTAEGIFLLTVPGNHDEITYNESVYREERGRWPGVLVTNPMPERVYREELNGMPVHFYSLAYTGGLTKSGKIDRFPREKDHGLHIGCFHGSLDWEGIPDRSLPLRSGILEKAGYHYIALGHYHTALEKRIGQGRAVYPGAPEFKSFHDPGVGKLTVAEIHEESVKLEKHTIDTQPFHEKTMDLSGMNNIGELLEQCKNDADGKLMMKYHLTGVPRFHIDHELLHERLAPMFRYVEVVNEALYFSDEFLERIIKEPTIRGLFAKRMKEKAENAETPEEKKLIENALLEGLAAIEGRGSSIG